MSDLGRDLTGRVVRRARRPRPAAWAGGTFRLWADQAVEGLLPPPARGTVSGEIACTEFGDGPAALFVHRIGTSGVLWRRVKILSRGFDGTQEHRRARQVAMQVDVDRHDDPHPADSAAAAGDRRCQDDGRLLPALPLPTA